jgi:hypothetical protein
MPPGALQSCSRGRSVGLRDSGAVAPSAPARPGGRPDSPDPAPARGRALRRLRATGRLCARGVQRAESCLHNSAGPRQASWREPPVAGAAGAADAELRDRGRLAAVAGGRAASRLAASAGGGTLICGSTARGGDRSTADSVAVEGGDFRMPGSVAAGALTGCAPARPQATSNIDKANRRLVRMPSLWTAQVGGGVGRTPVGRSSARRAVATGRAARAAAPCVLAGPADHDAPFTATWGGPARPRCPA